MEVFVAPGGDERFPAELSSPNTGKGDRTANRSGDSDAPIVEQDPMTQDFNSAASAQAILSASAAVRDSFPPPTTCHLLNGA